VSGAVLLRGVIPERRGPAGNHLIGFADGLSAEEAAFTSFLSCCGPTSFPFYVCGVSQVERLGSAQISQYATRGSEAPGLLGSGKLPE
jgi:hypothetical protein